MTPVQLFARIFMSSMNIVLQMNACHEASLDKMAEAVQLSIMLLHVTPLLSILSEYALCQQKTGAASSIRHMESER